MKIRLAVGQSHSFVRLLVGSVVVLLALAAPAQAPPGLTPGPVPPALLSAKSVFLANAGADSGLFPEPFSGDTNRPYTQFYAALKRTGQFKLVDDPGEADLVLELQLTAPYGPTKNNKQNGTADPLPMFRLAIYDRKSHYLLWALTESVEVAVLQKTHDRNFDDALNILLDDFLKVTGKHATQAR